MLPCLFVLTRTRSVLEELGNGTCDAPVFDVALFDTTDETVDDTDVGILTVVLLLLSSFRVIAMLPVLET